MKKNGVSGIFFNGSDGCALGGVERVVDWRDIWSLWELTAAIFGNATRKSGLNDGRKWAAIVAR